MRGGERERDKGAAVFSHANEMEPISSDVDSLGVPGADSTDSRPHRPYSLRRVH